VTFGRRLWVHSESRAVSIDWQPPYAQCLSDLREDADSADSQEPEFHFQCRWQCDWEFATDSSRSRNPTR